jgi:lipoteichoic acid synthase
LLLFGLSVVNLLFMHGQMAMTVEFEYPFKPDAIWSNVFSCLIDTTFFFLLSLLLTKGRVKGALLLTFVLTALLSFCNVLYSRFFGHYLPNLAFLQVGNLYDNDVMGSALTGFRWQDLFYILWIVLFGWLYKRYNKVELKTQWLKTMGWLWGVMLAGIIAFILVLGLLHDHNLKTSFIRFSPIKQQYTQAPNNMLYRSGFLRRALVCYDDFTQKELELDESQKKAIRQEFTDYSQRTTTATVKGAKNLIFVIVESYLAVTSDLTVNGKEITPFLNRLKRDSAVYYNGHVLSNINMGESSDGQFIYMTGLLPMKCEITVNIAKDKRLIGLPELLKQAGRMKQTQIIVPTSPTFWEQDKMNERYGIDTMYSKFDCPKELHGNEDLNDEQVFELAAREQAKASRPFFSLVVTMSMHNPYNKCVEHGFTVSDKSYTAEFLNYLVDCHYTDLQIEKYINELKRQGLYDNSVIVITADHHAHAVHLGMAESRVKKDLPLYIINGGIDKRQAWTGFCNQLDVYTTLLDMYGVRSDWRGLGHTLLNGNYKDYPLDRLYMLSDWIIRSNYFGGK